MSAALVLLLVQGFLGALDTLWYHEYVYALPANPAQTGVELRLHALRDCVYATLFLTLPFCAWTGAWAYLLGGLLAAEIVITLTDFAIEDRVREPYGGVVRGERVMHAVMAIVYGAFLAQMVPDLLQWAERDTGFPRREASAGAFAALFVALGVGVLLSGLRDLGAAQGMGLLQWPHRSARRPGR